MRLSAVETHGVRLSAVETHGVRLSAVETHGVRLSDEIAMPAAPQQVRGKKTLTGRVAPCEGYGKAPHGI